MQPKPKKKPDRGSVQFGSGFFPVHRTGPLNPSVSWNTRGDSRDIIERNVENLGGRGYRVVKLQIGRASCRERV